jgi:parvulin-like peptidyl-prolyl isomerase
VKNIGSAIFLIAFLFLANFSALAQETELKVVDEVVAQVNEGVITLSRVKREMNDVVESYVQEGKKTREQARTEVDGKQGELIANIINEELLIQKGKELGIESDVDAQINQRFLDIMKQQNIKSLDVLYKEMEKTGVNPESIRELWRKQFTRDMVLQREVSSKLYYGWTPKEVKSYFEANKAKFTKPATIGISEIFLGFAGRDEAAVREKAKQLVEQLRAGADFGKLAAENSDRPGAAENKGKVGVLNLKDLDERFTKALQTVKVGGVSDPIELVEGIEILRVDEKTNASSESFFDEGEVRRTMTYEKLPDEQKKYMSGLRQEAYIKINDTYRPLVSPFLFTDQRKAEVKNSK